jgi:hypothetical protein
VTVWLPFLMRMKFTQDEGIEHEIELQNRIENDKRDETRQKKVDSLRRKQ